ncbi:ABC transporter ATP-binding protein [Ahrensia marina]|uniref:ABC transporter ATP-binding protein n=1 Tax=Ahrensia marina TaxID=1514904 RepID=UPI0035D0CD8B
MVPALSLVGVSKVFGGFHALDDVSFAVAPGEVHALLGENGAGKSTLMNVATGLYAPDKGHIEMDGAPVAFSGARDAAERGVGMVHQHYKLVPSFSVLENLRLFNPALSEEALIKAARSYSEQIGFNIDFARRVGDLSVAEQQRVEILKVLVAGARIIILDEPTAVLSDVEALGLMKLVAALAEAGKAIVLVTHKLHEALEHSARITVIRAGRKIVETVPAKTDAQQLTTDIVGSLVVEAAQRGQERGPVRLRMAEVKQSDEAGRKGLEGATLIVHDGEIVGVAGVAGNGQSELARVLAGLASPDGGSIEIIGAGDASDDTPKARRKHGVATIPVDRYTHGLAGEVSVTDNFAIRGALGGRYGGWLRYRRGKARQDTQKAIEDFEIQGVRSLGQRAALLSGGNAQKLVLAREFQGEPSLVVAHSPTRGLDVRASAAVHARLRAARDRGAAVVLISEDLDEVLALSDRIAVLSKGRVAAEFEAPAERADIGRAMVGDVVVGHA